jgi:hypothetical protein
MILILWIEEKSSHCEYSATNVDDILIWSKDLMAVINSFEKTFIFKNVDIPEYYLGGNVEFLGEAWKNQGLGLALSAKTWIQRIAPKFEGFLARNLSSSRHPLVKDTILN